MEKILVVPKDRLFRNGFNYFNGFLQSDHLSQTFLKNITLRDGKLILHTGEVEQDLSKKQIVTYTLVTTEKNRETLFWMYKRKEGDKRLFDLYSFGVGGHVNTQPRQKED